MEEPKKRLSNRNTHARLPQLKKQNAHTTGKHRGAAKDTLVVHQLSKTAAPPKACT
jgi:hypothetical protein